MDFLVTYADVPFILDSARVFRVPPSPEEIEVGTQLAPRRYQPEADLIDEIDRLIPFQYLRDFSLPPAFPGRNISAIARKPEAELPDPQIKINDYYYPNMTSRWSVFRGLATSTQTKKMLELTNISAGSRNATFVMQAVPDHAVGIQRNYYSISTSLYMLPPRPLAEHGDEFDGLYLITLVDERYYFQGTPVSLKVTSRTTWTDLIDQLVSVLGITLSSFTPPSIYGYPEPDSHLWSNWESAPVLLDAIAANLGCVVVRNYDGTYKFQTHYAAKVAVDNNRGLPTRLIRTAGGEIFNVKDPNVSTSVTSSGLYRIGNTAQSRNSVIPTTVNVTCPKYIFGDDPVPHFLNPRYHPSRPSHHYEESFGESLKIAVPITSGGVSVSGLLGQGEQTLHVTAKALYSGEANATDNLVEPLNYSGLLSLCNQLVTDFYDKTAYVALDECYPGTYKWSPEGIHDIIWTYSSRSRQSMTRLLRPSWTNIITEFQHATPSVSGMSHIPRGVGGPSVAQTQRDAFQFSGSVIYSKIGSLLSGTMQTTIEDMSYFPTNQQWKGRIGGRVSESTTEITSNEEIVLVESVSGNTIKFAQRGIDGTLEKEHSVNEIIQWINPQQTYGVNLVTHGKGQFVFPGVTTSGGIQEAIVVPQTQSVMCLQNSGPILNSVQHYWGMTKHYNTTQASGSEFVSGEPALLIERNHDTLVSGDRYDGQFVGYSRAYQASGLISYPVYAVNIGGGAAATETSFLAQLTAKCYYDGSDLRDLDGFTPLGPGLNCPPDLSCLDRFIIYSWIRVEETEGDGCPMAWRAISGSFGGNSCRPAYHVNNQDLPVFPAPSPQLHIASASSGLNWTAPDNVTSSDDAYASYTIPSGGTSDVLQVTGFCFGIAGNAEIQNIEVLIEGHADGNGVTASAQLLYEYGVISTTRSNGTEFTTTDTEISIAGDQDSWGIAISPLEVNNAGFGVNLTFNNSTGESRTIFVDAVSISVTYSPSGQVGAFRSIVRLRKGAGDYYLIDQQVWIDLFRRTDVSDADGIVGYRRYWDQNAGEWRDGEEVRIVVAG